jgi:integrase
MGRPKKREREPFWNSRLKCYYFQVGTRQVRLSPDRAEAWVLWGEMKGRMAAGEAKPDVPAADPFVVVMVERFLEWAGVNRGKRTYDIYRWFLEIFADGIPRTLAMSALKPYHVTKIMDANDGRWSANTKNDFAGTVQRAFNWALAEGLIDRNPLARVSKPGREARELVVSPEDYAEVMAAVRESNFRALLEFAWESGARPQEIRAIEARHIDFDAKRIVFPPKESKGKKRHRVIYLTDAGLDILRPLAAAHPAGPVFRSSRGKPWTKDTINAAFVRLKGKIGRKLHLGAWRKGYATEALKGGIDTVSVAALLGHTNAAMISRVYGQVQRDPKYMAELAERVKATRKSAGPDSGGDG